MKIQCACGAKYAFDITPEMAREPIQFVCQNCGVDSSQIVNEIIRQQFGVVSQPVANPPVAVARPKAVAVAVVTNASPAAAAPAPAVAVPQTCVRHSGEMATEKCFVCGKPICPKCMELFGYLCSPHCRGKAELQGLDVPVYENQKMIAATREWRKVVRWAATISLVIAAILGVWFYYAWFASVPKATFSVRFDEAGYSGQCRFAPPDQMVFLHGGRLVRHDMKKKTEVWSQWLIDKKKIAEDAVIALEQMKKERTRAVDLGADPWNLPPINELTANMIKNAAAALEMHVQGENLWVRSPEKLTRFDWQTGKASKEIPLDDLFARVVRKEDEFLIISRQDDGGQSVNHVNLVSGDSRAEQIALPGSARLAANASAPAKGTAASAASKSNKVAKATGTTSNQVAGLSKARAAAIQTAAAKPGQAADKPLDPQAIAAKAQNMSLPGRLALPATLSAAANQQRLQAALREQPEGARPAAANSPDLDEHASLIMTKDGFVQFSVKLLEQKVVARQVMKDPPKKSALDGPINQAATAAIANEILNEMTRDALGSTALEDVSRYQVTVRIPGGKEKWSGEVAGPPHLFPLKTVYVVASDKSVLVLDTNFKKLWDSKLNYTVHGSRWDFDDDPTEDSGPCVERGNTLYIFDEGVLTSFDLTTGNVRWRLPSMGIAGLFFDDKGMLYVNTTTASPDSIKYSRQIDVTDKTRQVILKIDPKSGKTLWSAQQEGMISYISGKFIYTVQRYEGDDEITMSIPGAGMPPHVRIKRLDPDNGHVLWEHYQGRAPLDVQFDKNTIQLLFKKEVQFLRFFSL